MNQSAAYCNLPTGISDIIRTSAGLVYKPKLKTRHW